MTLPTYSKELAEFVGICLGDGCVRQYQVSITLNTNADREYIPYVKSLIKKLFPEVHISHVLKDRGGATDIRINSSIVSNFFKAMGIIPHKKKIPVWIFADKAYRKACVRGLFDTEGSISFKKYISKKGVIFYKQLNFRNIDMELMRLVRNTLLEIGLKPTMSLAKSLYISNQLAIDSFRNEIGFRNPKLVRKSLGSFIPE